MAKTPASSRRPAPNSTKPKPAPKRKLAAPGKSTNKPALIGEGEKIPYDCCAVMLAAASGTLFTVEDGVIVEIPPPTVASFLAIDPAGSGFPYWEPR